LLQGGQLLNKSDLRRDSSEKKEKKIAREEEIKNVDWNLTTRRQ